jgi:ABC-type uncharacterized transport system permease subunit
VTSVPWRIERRVVPGPVGPYRVGAIVAGIAAALILGPLVTGVAAGTFYDAVWTSTYGSGFGFSNVLVLATPLLFTALAACIPYQLRLWNIGADGQMYLGAWAAAGLAFSVFGDWSGPALIAVMLVGAALGGAVWILIPAIARAYLGINEIITTLMLNFAGFYWLLYWATGPWKNTQSAGGVQSTFLPDKTNLPTYIWGVITIPSGFIAGAVVGALLWAYLRYSRLGYELDTARESEGAAAYAGIPVARRVLAVMLVGGALGGLAGAVEMMGNTYQYSPAISAQTGYIGIVVAILAAGSALGAVPIAVLFASIIAGGNALSTAGVESTLVIAVMGLMLLVAAVGDGAARWRLVRRQATPPPGEPAEDPVGRPHDGSPAAAKP